MRHWSAFLEVFPKRSSISSLRQGNTIHEELAMKHQHLQSHKRNHITLHFCSWYSSSPFSSRTLTVGASHITLKKSVFREALKRFASVSILISEPTCANAVDAKMHQSDCAKDKSSREQKQRHSTWICTPASMHPNIRPQSTFCRKANPSKSSNCHRREKSAWGHTSDKSSISFLFGLFRLGNKIWEPNEHLQVM